MGKGRLEAFTDGVMAIIITIMVLEIKVPPGTDLAAFSSSLPILFTYALSGSLTSPLTPSDLMTLILEARPFSVLLRTLLYRESCREA
jgi:hypothetical protein